jgi:hypothetical protein
MEEVFTILRNFEHENQTFCESVVHLETNQVLTSLRCISTMQPQPKELWICLPHKFDGACSKFQNFVNQMCLVIRLHPHWFPIGPTQIGFISILLLGKTLVWFAPLLEHQAPFLNNFETFLKKFNATFGKLDKERISSIT